MRRMTMCEQYLLKIVYFLKSIYRVAYLGGVKYILNHSENPIIGTVVHCTLIKCTVPSCSSNVFFI